MTEQETIEELIASRDDWKQCAQVEAGLRREFKQKADAFEVLLREVYDCSDDSALCDRIRIALGL